MTKYDSESSDMALMRRCIALAQSPGSRKEYPFAAVIGRRGEFICESLNMSEMNEMLRDTPKWSQSPQLRKSCDPRASMSARSTQPLSPAPCVLTPSGKAGSVG